MLMSTRSPLHPHALGSAYPVALPAFQGPLDLLLRLIEQEELDISAISLVAVTDQYLQTIEQMQEREPGALADFLVVASKLLYIKSRTLLPKPQPPVEGEDEDPSDALIKQLLAYRQFKEVATLLGQREALGLRTFVRPATPLHLEKQLDLSNLDLDKLQAVLCRVLQRIPSEPPLPRVKTYSITVAEQIEQVRMQLQRVRHMDEGGISFEALLRQGCTRLEVIVTFLAVLELIKQQEVSVAQDGLFGEIVIQPLPSSFPTDDSAHRASA
jgi:segregation and condensation protein A